MTLESVVDGDGHVSEPLDIFLKYMDADLALKALNFGPESLGRTPRVEGYDVPQLQGHKLIGRGLHGLMPLINSAGRRTDEVFSGRLRYEDGPAAGFDGHARLAVLDREGIDAAVLYPSIGLVIGNFGDDDVAAAMSRAYNTWLYEYCSADRDRLIGVGCVPMRNVERAIAELYHCVEECGFRTVFVRPNMYGGRTFDDPIYDPFWAAAQELGVPVGFHPAGLWDLPGTSRLFQLPDMMYVACAAFPIDSMMTLTFLLYGGVLERFPELQVVVLESGADWLAHWIDRLDHYWEVFPSLRPHVPLPPSTYVKRQCWFGVGADDSLLPLVVQRLGDEHLLWSSDYPHFDAVYPGAVAATLERLGSLLGQSQQRIFGENARKLYRIAPASNERVLARA
jgi:predicted TIM-barrel fold metal-dependent hydrolase